MSTGYYIPEGNKDWIVITSEPDKQGLFTAKIVRHGEEIAEMQTPGTAEQIQMMADKFMEEMEKK